MRLKPDQESVVVPNKVDWKLWGKVAGVVILLVISYIIGTNNAGAEIDGEKVKYDELIKIIDAKQDELSKANADLEDSQGQLEAVKEEISSNQVEIDRANEVLKNEETINEKIDDLNSQLAEKKFEVTQLDASIETKSEELSRLEDGIVKKQEEPIVLPAGQFVVGKDIPAGRYLVTSVGRGSNFFVDDQNGSSVANQIIGTRTGVSEYVVYLDTGYSIDANASFKFTPIE